MCVLCDMLVINNTERASSLNHVKYSSYFHEKIHIFVINKLKKLTCSVFSSSLDKAIEYIELWLTRFCINLIIFDFPFMKMLIKKYLEICALIDQIFSFVCFSYVFFEILCCHKRTLNCWH